MAGDEKGPRRVTRGSSRGRGVRVAEVENGRGKKSRLQSLSGPIRRGGAWVLHSGWKVQVPLAIAACILIFIAVCAGIFFYYYYAYVPVVDHRLRQPLFANTAKIYAAPREVRPDQKYNVRQIAQDLTFAGYSPKDSAHPSKIGTFEISGNSIHVSPGPESYYGPDGATIDTSSQGVVASIKTDDGQTITAYDLEPELITGLSDKNRGKRRLVTFDELPKYLVPAVTSIEDRHFFEHGAVDYTRIFGAALADLRSGSYSEGSSTLTMQVARLFFLSPAKRWRRKVIQTAIAFQLENRYSKQQIFTIYANEVPLGQRGSFAIIGFGEAAQAYFGKNIRNLDLPECALLAGIIQGPSRLSPYRHPHRALVRRNVVLDAMVETGDITPEQAKKAKAAPLGLTSFSVDEREAPYFVDLVRDKLVKRYGDRDINSEGLRIYTSLDPDLQTIAAGAVRQGMEHVDKILQARYDRIVRRLRRRGKSTDSVHLPHPQVALVAMDPHTGQVLAIIGGRNYGSSQLNHALSQRPTGSIFKPIVYATAFNSSLTGVPLPGQQGVFTALTMLNDDDTTFTYDNGTKQYSPHNFKHEQMGTITARTALMLSQNIATIQLAQMVGLDNVVALAHQAGIVSAQATPSVAIGAYDASPLQMATAYTIFANNGLMVDPNMIASVRTANGDIVDNFAPVTKPVLDPRVSYLTLSLMRDVINHGTAEGVRAAGFSAPAAGKTGTSHDAWFAGFTSNLLCVVWVGNDDYSDIDLQGAEAAAPIWTAFMKKAVQLPQYSDTQFFDPPAGVTEVSLDKTTNLLADAACPDDYTVAFLTGTQPTATCNHPNADQRNVFQKMFGLGGSKPSPPNIPPAPANVVQPQPPSGPAQTEPSNAKQTPNENQPTKEKKKKGFFGKIFGVFGGGDDTNGSNSQQPPQDQ